MLPREEKTLGGRLQNCTSGESSPLQPKPVPALSKLVPGKSREGKPRLRAASLSSGRKESQKLLAYSLNTKTRVCPEKRTSFTWPFSPMSTESLEDFVARSSQRPSLSAMTCFPFSTVALFPSICRRYSPARRSALPIFADWAMLMVLLNGFARRGTVEIKAAASARLRRIELNFMRVNFLSVRIESAAWLLPQAEQNVDTRAQGE